MQSPTYPVETKIKPRQNWGTIVTTNTKIKQNGKNTEKHEITRSIERFNTTQSQNSYIFLHDFESNTWSTFFYDSQVAYRRGALACVIVVVEHAAPAKISQEQVVVKKQYSFKDYISRSPKRARECLHNST